jgi:hypothetical protein
MILKCVHDDRRHAYCEGGGVLELQRHAALIDRINLFRTSYSRRRRSACTPRHLPSRARGVPLYL